MASENGNVKWPQAATIAISLLTVSVGLATAATNTISANEKACRDRRDAVMVVIEANQKEVLQRLTTIETLVTKRAFGGAGEK